MSDVRLCSSLDVINALKRAGFVPARRATGTHQVYVRENADGTKSVTTVVLGKKEVTRGTLRNILRQASISIEEFRALL